MQWEEELLCVIAAAESGFLEEELSLERRGGTTCCCQPKPGAVPSSTRQHTRFVTARSTPHSAHTPRAVLCKNKTST